MTGTQRSNVNDSLGLAKYSLFCHLSQLRASKKLFVDSKYEIVLIHRHI
jgi:hypothetical protein